MNKTIKKSLAYLLLNNLLFTLLLSCNQASARQVTTYNRFNIDTIKLYSKILNQERLMYIRHPAPDAGNSQKQFPVLYLLDGESHFEMLVQHINYLARADVNAIPEMIVVGITNIDRTKDLTPTQSYLDYYGHKDTSSFLWNKPSGGNEKFLQFIGSELIPYIDKHYHSQPYKIFAGHSFGGIASIHCMLTQPHLFDAYISLSPSLWWDNKYILKLAQKKLITTSGLNKKLFYSDADEGLADSSSFHTDLLQFDSLLHSRKLPGLNYRYQYYPAETHMTTALIGYYHALRFIFKDWKPQLY